MRKPSLLPGARTETDLRKATVLLRILYCTSAEMPSRMAHSVHVAKMAQGFRTLGHRVLLAVPRWSGARWTSIADFRSAYGLRDSYPVARVPGRVAREGQSAPRVPFHLLVAFLARAWRADLVLGRDFLAPLAAARLGTPSAVETHRPVDGPPTPYQAATFDSLRHPRGLRLLVTISDVLRDMYVAAGAPPQKVLVEHDAVDLERYEPPLDREEARRRLALDPRGPWVVYTGHLYPDRGIGDLLEAARRLPAVRFALVGGHDADVAVWRERARGLGNVVFAGFVPNGDLPRWQFAADVLVMPSSASLVTARWTSPMKLFEYMAARRPVVCTSLPSLAGLLADGETAVFCRPDDPEDLSCAVRRLLGDPDLAGRVAGAARTLVERHTWKERARRILAALRRRPA